MKQLRLSIFGFGVVGQGCAELLATKHDLLRERFGFEVKLVSVANSRHGFIYREDGLDIPTLLELAARRKALTDHPGVQQWDNTLEGLRASGGEVLAEAQAQGYAEADPTADVEGYDVVAKALILSALVFGHSLAPDQVVRQGITAITKEQIHKAAREGKPVKLVASLKAAADLSECPLDVRVEPLALPLSDPLARVEGVMNDITFETDTLSDVTVIGPGAGRQQTGQGLLADLIAIAKTKG